MANPTQLDRITGEASTARGRSGIKRIETKAKSNPRAWHRPDVDRDKAQVPTKYRNAIAACCNGASRWPLYLGGPTGTGKTCAALVLCDHVREPALFQTFAEVCEELIDAMQGNLKEENVRRSRDTIISPRCWWERWHNYGVCALDEIGTRERITDFQLETMLRCLDGRDGLPLVLTGNLKVDDIANLYDDRIASRLEGGTYVWLDGDDRRST